jgi:hypothetical protein
VVALAAAKLMVLAAVAASRPNLPYLSRNALMVFIERTSEGFNPDHGRYLREMPTPSVGTDPHPSSKTGADSADKTNGDRTPDLEQHNHYFRT